MSNKLDIQKVFAATMFLLVVLLGVTTPQIAKAQANPKCVSGQNGEFTEYCLLAPIPLGGGGQVTTKTDASQYLSGLFKLAIGLSSALAVVMLIYAGIKYMTTDAFSQKNEAKGIIENAIWGLVLALSAWMVLYTIDPKLVEFKLEISDIPTPVGPTVQVSGPMTPADLASHEAVKARLNDGGIPFDATPCTQGQTRGCTNLNGLPPHAIEGVITFKKDCGCTIRITGGTEGGHKTHGVGKPILDLGNNPAIRTWLESKGFVKPGENNGSARLSNGNNISVTFEPAGTGNSTGDHWHVVF